MNSPFIFNKSLYLYSATLSLWDSSTWVQTFSVICQCVLVIGPTEMNKIRWKMFTSRTLFKNTNCQWNYLYHKSSYTYVFEMNITFRWNKYIDSNICRKMKMMRVICTGQGTEASEGEGEAAMVGGGAEAAFLVWKLQWPPLAENVWKRGTLVWGRRGCVGDA